MILSIIVAFDERRLIGRDNGLPWHLPADLKYFKSITIGHSMIMGRKTFASIGKPLPGRRSVVITRTKGYAPEGITVVHSLDEALLNCSGEEEVFVIGGAQIFEQAMPLASKLYITQIHHVFEGDIFFPEIPEEHWELISKEDHEADVKNPWAYSFLTYRKK